MSRASLTLEVLAAFLGVLEVVGSKPVIFFHLVAQSLTFLSFARGGGGGSKKALIFCFDLFQANFQHWHQKVKLAALQRRVTTSKG